MKDTETKPAFIKAGSEGKNYNTIAKATYTSWKQSFMAGHMIPPISHIQR